MRAMSILGSCLLIVTAINLSNADAYEQATHLALAEEAARASLLSDAKARSRIGLRYPIDSNNVEQLYPGSKEPYLSVLRLIRNGADWEDDFPPGPIYHFFNPATGLPLTLNALSYPDVNPLLVFWINSFMGTSPDWVILGNGVPAPVFIPSWGWPWSTNKYSIPKAKDYFFKSLTEPVPTDRKANMGLLFESLGRMTHHLQDMAQPQHVRNDNHLQDNLADWACSIADVGATSVCQNYRSISRASAYESWTNRPQVLPILPVAGYPPVYPGTGNPADGLNVFKDSRAFWIGSGNSGKGIAEYTNRNFFSQGTLDVVPPITDAPFDVSHLTLCSGAVPACGRTPPADEMVTFFPSHVDDQFRPETSIHYYAKSVSIFDPEFQNYTGQRLPSVNRFTFAVDHQLLLPRAVGYSAGLINYFFRGDMEISLPDEGVYGVVDTSGVGCGSPCGFRKIKLKLRNATPGSERMGQGTLLAIARFHLNTCYQSDLSGEFGGPPNVFQGASCRSPAEFVAVSNPLPVVDGAVDPVTPQLFPFDFGTTPIPINASDLDLQIVFRGKLGQETDGIAVSTKNIAEPNFWAVANITDYAFDLNAQQYYPVSSLLYNAPVPMTDVALFLADPALGAQPLARLPLLDAAEHAQLAFLTDPGNYHYWFHATRFDYSPDENFDVPVQTFGLTENAPPVQPVYGRDCPVSLERGIYREFFRYFIQIRHGIVGQAAQLMSIDGVHHSPDPRKEVKVGEDCFHAPDPGSGGLNDLSAMVPLFSPTTAKQWEITFGPAP